MENLNQEQQRAISHQGGPLLIIAGAGTGKTTVLIQRLKYLVENGLASADQILLLTFTEKAAGELEDRALKALPLGTYDLWINTFHGFCERLLRDHALDIGMDPSFKLLNQTEQWIFLKKNIDKLSLDYYRPVGNPNKFLYELVKHFSRLKDEDIKPAEYLHHAEELMQNQDTMLIPSKGKKKAKLTSASAEADRISELANAYHTYNQMLLNSGYLDFGDLITSAIKLFNERPQILKQYQEKFKYIMVDEFQDTNWAQYELIKILTGETANLVVVGDDDQAIYKFRGASLSNIMQFKDDYPKAEEIVLIKNYRSGQAILDRAYEFITHNNPNRLEEKLKIVKRLESGIGTDSKVQHLDFKTEQSEASWIADEIKEIKKTDQYIHWSDFAILVRANDTADKYVKELETRGIPCLFLSSRGLYLKPIIMDVCAYLRLLDNYHESSALFRVLSMEPFKVPYNDIIEINHFAHKKVMSMFEALKNASAIRSLAPETIQSIARLIGLIEKHSALAKSEKPSQIYVRFIWDSGLNRQDYDQHADHYAYLNQFYQKILSFEADLNQNKEGRVTLKDFVELINLEMEAGDTGSLKPYMDDNDMVKIMTVHGAKGLEFNYVFIPNLVDKKFPTINRQEKIGIPDALVREKLPEGKAVHLEEERRLFYVAMTRAKKELYLSSARDCGGVREKKPSVFLAETGIETKSMNMAGTSESALMRDLALLEIGHLPKETNFPLPSRFSFSQIEAYGNCPLQYKYNFVLKIPVETKPVMIFGRLIHDTMKEFFQTTLAVYGQADLFGKEIADNDGKKPSEKDLMEIFKRKWQTDGYASKQEREEYRKKGENVVKLMYKHLETEGWPDILFLEKNFVANIGGTMFKGAIDRVDSLGAEGVEIMDYKTGNPKEKLEFSNKRQLLLYKLALEQCSDMKVAKLSYFYLENGTKLSFVATDKDMDKLISGIEEIIANIKKHDFTPSPGPLCEFCDFKSICQFRKT